jgi:hypothetical protein
MMSVIRRAFFQLPLQRRAGSNDAQPGRSTLYTTRSPSSDA